MVLFTRRTQNVKDYMSKQELIDATDASGLSHASIAYESQTCCQSLIMYSNLCCIFWLFTILVDGLGQRREKGKQVLASLRESIIADGAAWRRLYIRD